MKNSKIFLVGKKEGNLFPMTETSFEKEDILQELLAKYPDLLAGDQIDPDNPRRWLFIARELGIPDETDESDKWSLDHLFLDQDAIPTFIECKRAADTRLRREVVSQMLDYAANGTEYWTMERLRQSAAETSRKSNRSLDDDILTLLESQEKSDIEVYWKLVETNLRCGKVRLVFVSDSIPKELRRLVEFLNEQMMDTEVLAVEIKQFIGEQQKAIVPRVIGLTESARSVKAKGATKGKTNQVEFLAKCSPEGAQFFKYVLDEALKYDQTVRWGISGFSIGVALSPGEHWAPISFGYPENRLEIYPNYLEYLNVPLDEIAIIRKELLSFKIFKEGQKALLVKITTQNKTKVIDSYNFWISKINSFLKRNS